MGYYTGTGRMIQMLGGGNEETMAAYGKAKGKKIKGVALVKDDGPDKLELRFEDGTGIKLYDGAQSCCESRYMECDCDDLEYYAGSKFMSVSIKDGPTTGDVLECQFLVIKTSKGELTVSNYNSHNGCYGGIGVEIREIHP